MSNIKTISNAIIEKLIDTVLNNLSPNLCFILFRPIPIRVEARTRGVTLQANSSGYPQPYGAPSMPK